MTVEALTLYQAAEVLGVHPETIRNLIRRGKLKAGRIGSRAVRISRADLAKYYKSIGGGDLFLPDGSPAPVAEASPVTE